MRRGMANLEQEALRRDRRFIVRLVLALVLGAVGGIFIFGQLTGARVASCAAEAFGGVTGDPPSE